MTAKTAFRSISDKTAGSDKYLPAQGQVTIWETGTPGFGLRLSAGGARTWIVQKRLHGRMVRYKIARYPELGPKAARKEAKRILELMGNGKDPRDERREAAEAQATTFGALRDLFLEQYADAKAPATANKYRGALKCPQVKPWARKPIHTITHRDVRAALDAIATEGRKGRGAPVQANRTRAYLMRFFGWCIERDLIDKNPISRDRIKRHNEQSRDRYLQPDEIKRVWNACSFHRVYGPAVRLILATGQRPGEVAGIEWHELHNLDGNAPEWHLPADKAKNGSANVIPLSPLAVRIIRGMPALEGGPYVFSTNGGKPFTYPSKLKAQLDAAAKVQGWTNHDLRRTVETNLAEIGVPQEVSDKILNHKSGVVSGVRAVYRRYEYAAEKRQALEDWVRRLEAIIAGEEEGARKVVYLNRTRFAKNA